MIGKLKINQRWIGVAISLLLGVGLGLVLHILTMGSGLKRLSYDLLLVARSTLPTEGAMMVFLDEESYRQMDQPMNRPLAREIHAALIDRLAAAGAKSISFDVVFNSPSTPEADQRLADAMKKAGNVILAADNVPSPLVRVGKQQHRPIDLLIDAEAGLGSVEFNPDADLTIREHPPNTPHEIFPSLSWATAEFLKAPITAKPGADGVERWINYYGPPDWVPHISYYKVFDTNLPAANLFRGKVVFVGARTFTRGFGERKDEYPNPFSFFLPASDPHKFLSGVEVHATAFLNLVRDDCLRRMPLKTQGAIFVVVGLVFGLGLISLRPILTTTIGLGSCILVAAASYLLFRTKLIWFPWLIPILQICAVLLWSIIFNSIQLYVQKKLYEQTLANYLSPKLVKKFSKDKSLMQRGAHKQLLTILFTDIANFTSISEGLDSNELAKFMNNYFQSSVAECIFPTDGTVVKYIGDAIFAFWNAPDQQLDHQVRACQAGLLFRQQPVHYINGKPLYTRLGLHTGLADVGNFGSTERFDYTALGENINLAARMEGLNKYLGTQVLLTGDTKQGIDEQFTLRFLGLFQLKGFNKAIEVYELVAGGDQKEKTKAWRETFAEGVQQFQKRNFDAAETAFTRTLKLKPDDGPSKFLLARIAELRDEDLPGDWRGEIELKEK